MLKSYQVTRALGKRVNMSAVTMLKMLLGDNCQLSNSSNSQLSNSSVYILEISGFSTPKLTVKKHNFVYKSQLINWCFNLIIFTFSSFIVWNKIGTECAALKVSVFCRASWTRLLNEWISPTIIYEKQDWMFKGRSWLSRKGQCHGEKRKDNS